ncbi:MAG: DNA-primase RepB domain-containing protein [bacterium]|nr:DNA-primase RepB domain-containing protein [bacterium]
MRDESLDFLDHLYSRCQTSGFLTLTAIHPDGGRPSPSRHISLRDRVRLIDSLQRLHAANAAGWGAYFAVGLRKDNLGRYRRGGAAEVAMLPALYVDVDDASATSRAKLDGFTPAPSMLVRSGGGFHAYWLLREATTDLERARRILRGLARELGGDTLSVAQSLRLPGTVNNKRGREPTPCRWLEVREHTYALTDFRSLADLYRPTRAFRPGVEARSAFPIHENTFNPRIVEAVSHSLLSRFDGYPKSNGYIAALCPCSHAHDHPGSHFNFDPEHAVGTCFGRHGRLLLKDLCALLGIDPQHYGGLYRRKETT